MQSKTKITFTDRELGLMGLALIKCDLLSSWGTLDRPWADDHDDDETLWILQKIDRMRSDDD